MFRWWRIYSGAAGEPGEDDHVVGCSTLFGEETGNEHESFRCLGPHVCDVCELCLVASCNSDDFVAGRTLISFDKDLITRRAGELLFAQQRLNAANALDQRFIAERVAETQVTAGAKSLTGHCCYLDLVKNEISELE